MNLKTEEIKVIAELPYSWEKIKDKTILVSGGTGFIGTAFVDVIKYRNQKYNENIKVISFSRRGGESSEYLECIKANVKQPLHYEGKIRCWRTVHIREIYSLICKACSHGKPWLLCYLAKTQLTFLAHFVILKLHICWT